MSKIPITWLGLIKEKLAEEKSKGKSPSIGDVTPLAKKEWVQIKEGKHPKYEQGKAQTFARKKKGSSEKKTKKNKRGSSESSSSNPQADFQQLLAEAKICNKCKKKVEKLMKKKGMKGGNVAAGASPVGNGGCSSCGGQGGGCGCSVV